VTAILIPAAVGELIDKITILEIKSAKLEDPDKRANVDRELARLVDLRQIHLAGSPELDRLGRELKTVNEMLWDIEDDIRSCERQGDFGPRFVELARGVYIRNDRRAALKREINMLVGSDIVEEKSYAAY
jgi:hypothetical protein